MIRGPLLADHYFHRFLIFFLALGPFAYIYIHGWLNAKLIETTKSDNLVKFFYITSAALALFAYFASAPKGPWQPPNPREWKCTKVPAIGTE